MRLKEAEVFLVAVQGQDVARVVALQEMLVVLVGDGSGVLRELQQVLQPLAVLVQAEEGEMKRAAPGRREEERSRMSTASKSGCRSMGRGSCVSIAPFFNPLQYG